MAEAFPKSVFCGFDPHEASVAAARENAKAAGVQHRVSFDAGTAKSLPATGFDLVCFFDCLHDLGDPIGAAQHVRERLAQNGTVMAVEPFARDNLQDNLNPISRL